MLTQEIDMYILLKVQGLVVKGILLTDSHKKKKTCNEHKRHYIYKTDIFFLPILKGYWCTMCIGIYAIFELRNFYWRTCMYIVHVIHAFNSCTFDVVKGIHVRITLSLLYQFDPLPISAIILQSLTVHREYLITLDLMSQV